jgi:hypothetical protein
MGDDVMTHNFKTGVTYKTKGKIHSVESLCIPPYKCWYVGVAKDGRLVFDHDIDGICYHNPDGRYILEFNDHRHVIGLWEDTQEEIDVANMCVAIKRKDGSVMAWRRMYSERPSNLPADTIAFIRVSKWEAIKRGERKLNIGEGV